ncbi:MAG: hypothetical protein QXL81_02420 [Candidatus Aenigmatarchaeota archaeon]
MAHESDDAKFWGRRSATHKAGFANFNMVITFSISLHWSDRSRL